VRARLVQQTAETGLSQGAEWFKVNYSTNALDTSTGSWTQCGADETTFPCGTVEKCASANLTDSSGSTSDGTTCTGGLQRRHNMFYYSAGAGYDVNGNSQTTDALDTHSLPITQSLTTVGNGYTVNYGVGALLCMVKAPTASTDPTECTTDPSAASSIRLVTLTSVASIQGESAATTLQTTIGKLTADALPANAPPVVASGTVTSSGTLQIVTNPNSGGPGVPVSIWTRQSVDKTGTPNTCYLDGFIRDQIGNVTPTTEGVTHKIVTCDTCSCNSSAALSYPSSGSNNAQQGIDILDVDSVAQCTTSVTTNCKPNLNVQAGEFPCDLFAYVFGQSAYSDSDGDGFCETRITQTYNAADGKPYTMGADEAFLYDNATFIIPTTANKSKVASAKLATCSQLLNDNVTTTTLQGSAYGIVWDQQGCGIGSNKQAGTVDFPVLLVEDGNTKIQGRMFGLLFVRPDAYNTDTAGVTPLVASTGAGTDGTGCLEMDAGSAIYGSVVVMGTVCRINGTSAIIYNAQVLSDLNSESFLNPFHQVPGSWTDRFAY
jgi:hypothetical protein